MIAQSELQVPAIAVLGGGGFVGARLTQLAALSGGFRVVPVVRNYRSLARLGNAVPNVRVTDTKDVQALTSALEGCEAVINLTMGDPLRILADTRVMYQASVAAGARQFIHMSSAVVFGRVADSTTHDDSAPQTNSWMLYARAKAKAELWLRQQLSKRELQVVVLRPGLIWGPGSNWSEMVGEQLLHGRAALSNGGKGIANLVFVDNLVRVLLAVAGRNEPSGFYNVADREVVTWACYYQTLAERLGYPSSAIQLCAKGRSRVGLEHAVEWALEQPLLLRVAKGILKRAGPGTKAYIKAKLRRPPEPPKTASGQHPSPSFTRALWELHHTAHALPCAKLHNDFGPLDLIPFEPAIERTAAWLKFAGFGAPAGLPAPSAAVPQT